MLLLLTLAFLASPTCRAQNVLGNAAGKYFYVQGEDQGQLKGMRIFLSVFKFIKGFQLQFGSNWTDVYGTRSDNFIDFLLEDGEHVIKVEGSAVICLTSLTFTTNKGRVATFGVRRGRYFSDTGGSDKHLVTVNGMHAPGLCVRGIGFKWGNINANGNDHYNNKEDKADNKDADNKDADNKDDGDEDDDGNDDDDQKDES
ncbi:prostatic spermine-binding protein precursor [Mus musculus]|uniref:Prostatic spermine-binding protein n=2 Tax=Mus musculus TaxID=10090 RepID=SPBP_MOUSE|nr:prostatic spermine-binding protein precursor [Mus musculus]NP_001371026.1 prostatic spermine-binding protein precursor [Mus musculus]NP_001371027.1 prostatic spermine-binding protein precursor [Mus musculus]NP_001371029.1 prostatic spermine-binding protein precursor [Mus musculus]NP_035451.1 prostatic spermine-binding protein precursor [Mus musculus]P15501.1 RecName: Full=Prostatic spermine-binding protein; Short=SBP; AltName: Full=Major prostatic secretory glycoprotein; AltName: Full=P25; |eukprot:NP_035451.1 prostatic spermine-binding protein precursor [Mus musculus]